MAGLAIHWAQMRRPSTPSKRRRRSRASQRVTPKE
jgi:hypothetical protein